MRRRIELQGHRGARGLFPENTLVGFAGALAIGVDALELDVAMTADDVVVVTHDPRLNPDVTRTGEGAWLAPGRPSDPLAAMRSTSPTTMSDAFARAAAMRSCYPDQRPHDGATIPTLADALRIDPASVLQHRAEDVSPCIPASPSMVQQWPMRWLQSLTGWALPHRISVQSFDWRGPRHLRRARPDIATVLADACRHPRRCTDMVGRAASRRISAARCRVRWRRRVGPAGAPTTPT